MPFPANGPVTLLDLLLRTYRLLEDVAGLDSITQNILATPTAGQISFTVNDVSQWPVNSRIEVDYEVFMVITNPGGSGAGTVTVQRAFESTYAAAHTSGTFSRRDPRFLKETVWEAINVVLNDWLTFFIPNILWDDGVTAGTWQPTKWIYPVPATAIGVRRAVWQLPGFTRYVDVSHSDLNVYPTTICSTGVGFEVYDQIGLPGRNVAVEYEARWSNLINDTDTLDPLFPSEGYDLIPLGAVLYISGARMTPRWRTDEALFYREQNSPLPSNFNMQWLQAAEKRWENRAILVRARRPSRIPEKVYIGLAGGL